MKKSIITTGYSCLLAAILASTPSHSQMSEQAISRATSTASHLTVPDKTLGNNRYIVLFKNQPSADGSNKSQAASPTPVFDPVFNQQEFSSAKAKQLISTLGGQVIRALPSISAVSAKLTPQQLSQLNRNPQVALIEADPLRQLQAEVPSYGIGQIQADQLSDSNTGNITVCIADTGIDLAHEDLALGNNITGEVSNTLNVAVDIGEWYEDSHGHGTHMAGTIAAIGNNNLGSVAINPGGNIKLHIVKIVDNPAWVSGNSKTKFLFPRSGGRMPTGNQPHGRVTLADLVIHQGIKFTH